MREYHYSMEKMLQNINELNEEEKIIEEYKEMEGIEFITEEEMTNLFGSTYFDAHVYWYPPHMYGSHVYTYISDYEQYEIDNGYDPILGEYIDELERQEIEPCIERLESLQLLEDISDMH